MNITVEVQDAEVKALLQQVSSRYSNLIPVMTEIGNRMVRRVRDRFDTETDPDGNRWKPLKIRSYLSGYMKSGDGERRDKDGNLLGAYTKKGGWRAAFGRYLQNKRILVESGDLRDHIKPQATNSNVEWGTSGNENYAGVHQLGGIKRPIPARPYLGRNVGNSMEIADGDRKEILEIIMLHLNG